SIPTEANDRQAEERIHEGVGNSECVRHRKSQSRRETATETGPRTDRRIDQGGVAELSRLADSHRIWRRLCFATHSFLRWRRRGFGGGRRCFARVGGRPGLSFVLPVVAGWTRDGG